MAHQKVSGILAAALVSTSLTALAAPAVAQETDTNAEDDQAEDTFAQESSGGLQTIVVTARKREESVQDVPVAVSAYSEELITQRDITSVEKIAAIAPNFNVGRASNGSGAQLTLRGIGSSSTSIGIEQSVAVVVDGAYYGQGRVINEGFFDLSRVEVLKGPQALFFGKNATAGVISLTTNDPGPVPEFLLRAGYEFKANQYQVEGIASVPFNDQGGIRLALRGTFMDGGYYTNIADPVTYTTLDTSSGSFATATNPISGIAQPAPSPAPQEEEILGRLTLKLEPTDRLTMTVKASYGHNEVKNNSWNYVAYRCGLASGITQLAGRPCVQDFVTYQNNIPQNIAENFPLSRPDGQLFNEYESFAANGSIVYELDNFELTSVTNWQWNQNKWACACDFQSSSAGTWATEDSEWTAFSQELRILSQFDGAFNFMLGGLYQTTYRDFDQFVTFAGVRDDTVDLRNQFVASSKDSFTDGETYAVFGQLTFDITPELELAGGARYTHETKDSSLIQPFNNPVLSPGGDLPIFRGPNDPLGIVTANQEFNNWSPEATLTYQPYRDLLVYVAYKTAYKSGGFSNGGINSALRPDPTADLTFNPEEAEGFEAGIKATVLDNQLRLNLIAYTYDYKDLQVDFFNSPVFAFQTLTADAKTEGFEFEFEYAPYALDGLNVRGAINYTDARYTDFPDGPCYAGQTPAQGCDQPNTRQNLTGAPLSVAPEWTGTLGVSYDTDIGSDYIFGFNVDARYSDEYLASGFGHPLSLQDSYITLDAGLRFGTADGSWELAVIGKNLTNEFYVSGVVDGPSSGSGTGTAAGIPADQLGFGNLPRTVKVQVTSRF